MRQLQAQGRDIVVADARGTGLRHAAAHVAAAAQHAIRAGRTRYPDNRGELPLREAVAAKLQRDNGVRYDPATEILVTTGATLGIQAALMALVNDGDEVLLPDPIYDAYASPIRLAGGRHPTGCPVRMRDGRFTRRCRAARSRDHGPRSRVLILNTPWNPVGTVFPEPELAAIADVVVRRGISR